FRGRAGRLGRGDWDNRVSFLVPAANEGKCQQSNDHWIQILHTFEHKGRGASLKGQSPWARDQENADKPATAGYRRRRKPRRLSPTVRPRMTAAQPAERATALAK